MAKTIEFEETRAQQRFDLYNEIERSIDNGELEHSIVRDALKEILSGRKAVVQDTTTQWASVSSYKAKLLDWNSRFELGLDADEIHDVTSSLPDHKGIFRPTGISMTLGRSLQYLQDVQFLILEYELGKIGVPFRVYDQDMHPSYYRGAVPKSDRSSIEPALLALDRFWNPIDGAVVAAKVREMTAGETLPSTEVGWLLALQPHMYAAIHEIIPGMVAAGLTVGTNRVPVYGRGPRSVFVDSEIALFSSKDSAVVTFQK